MSEAIISRRGSKDSGSSSGNFVTEFIIQNSNYTVPEAINQQFEVMIFGGGGAYGRSGRIGGGFGSAVINSGGGGGGWMNNTSLTLVNGINISIIIGEGGVCELVSVNSGFDRYNYWNSTAGGTTFFGAYLSANGGEAGKPSGGGDGGSGGGGGVDSYSYSTGGYHNTSGRGGNGYQFGGGGGCGSKYELENSSTTYAGTPGGNGGIYGGGGGGGCVHGYRTSYGIGGTYGGNGGAALFYNNYYIANNSIDAENGTNTISENLIFNGNGIAGFMNNYNSSKTNKIHASAGGGGYGGIGGTADRAHSS